MLLTAKRTERIGVPSPGSKTVIDFNTIVGAFPQEELNL